jgi:hypothetical protein
MRPSFTLQKKSDQMRDGGGDDNANQKNEEIIHCETPP